MGRSTGDPRKGRDKKLPTGKEIMKRRTPDDLSLRPARFEFDPKKAYTTEQLAEIGGHNAKVKPDRSAYRICRDFHIIYKIAVLAAVLYQQNSGREI